MDELKILLDLRRTYRQETGEKVAGRRDVYTVDYTQWLQKQLVNKLLIQGVVKPLNFNINKDLKIKSLGDLKRAYPNNHSHRISSFGGCINYFVDGQLVYERKI